MKNPGSLSRVPSRNFGIELAMHVDTPGEGKDPGIGGNELYFTIYIYIHIYIYIYTYIYIHSWGIIYFFLPTIPWDALKWSTNFRARLIVSGN